MKHGSVTVEVHHAARMNAANAVNVKQGELVDFDASSARRSNIATSQKLIGVEKLRGGNEQLRCRAALRREDC
jgi:hypothetical protein